MGGKYGGKGIGGKYGDKGGRGKHGVRGHVYVEHAYLLFSLADGQLLQVSHLVPRLDTSLLHILYCLRDTALHARRHGRWAWLTW